jgi:16S rRNA (cytosine1402-N4)-methyltransferase
VSGRHEPVLLSETIAWWRNGPGLYLDATLGDAGHAAALLAAEPEARLLGCDRDPAALDFAARRLDSFGARVSLAHAAFRDLPAVHRRHGGEALAGVLLDLGMSSRQLDDPARGMSFQIDGPLDLRFDPGSGESAASRVARTGEDELARVLSEHGGVTGAARLARAMVAEAKAGRLATTSALASLVSRGAGGRAHPRRLAQVFQALRIWINEEDRDLDAVLAWLPDAMRPGGVVVTLAYHSGEDRKIKRALRGTPEIMPARRRPQHVVSRLPEGPWEELNRKVVTPTEEEKALNPRARSARLRAFRRNPR